MNNKYFKVSIENYIAEVSFNRPDKANSLNEDGWWELRSTFEALHENNEVRVIILTGEGKHFCAGMDLQVLMNLQQFSTDCEARKRERLRKFILDLQASISSMEQCRKPVLAAIQGSCIGGGVDIISACDMRYCTQDAKFSIREIDLGLVADMGTMQRLPTILNPGFMAELAYTGRNVSGKEAQQIGLVNRAYENREEMMENVRGIARTIAAKSPLVIRGTKEMLLYKRDNSVANSLDVMATWNAAMLMSRDIMEAFQSYMEKRPPVYKD